jgi:hypothetical protein
MIRAIGQAMWFSTISTAETAPQHATIEPTDRSMCPAMITRIMPIARIRMYEFWTMMLLMFCGCSMSPPVSTVNSSTISANAM